MFHLGPLVKLPQRLRRGHLGCESRDESPSWEESASSRLSHWRRWDSSCDLAAPGDCLRLPPALLSASAFSIREPAPWPSANVPWSTRCHWRLRKSTA